MFGVAAVISMLAVGEGASRYAQRASSSSARPTSSCARSSLPTSPGRDRPAGALILRYGLTYADYGASLKPCRPSSMCCRSAKSASRSAASSVPSTAVWSARRTTTRSSAISRWSKVVFSSATDDELYRNYAVLAHATAWPSSPTATRSARRSTLGSDAYTVIGVTGERAATAARAVALPARITIATSTFR